MVKVGGIPHLGFIGCFAQLSGGAVDYKVVGRSYYFEPHIFIEPRAQQHGVGFGHYCLAEAFGGPIHFRVSGDC